MDLAARRLVAPALLSACLAAAPSLPRAAGPAERRWKVGEVEFVLSAKDFRVSRGGKPVYSARKEVEAELAEYRRETRAVVKEAEPDQEIDVERVEAGYQIVPLSVVGTIVSLDLSGGGDSPFAAHPNAWEYVQAVDVARPPEPGTPLPARAASLLDLWPERQLLDAFLADRYLKKLLPAGKPPATLAELWQVLGDAKRPEGDEDPCLYDVQLGEGALTSFSFHHLQGGKVAVRVVLPYGSEICRGRTTELGLLLPIPAGLADALAAADRLEAGYLAQSLKKLGSPAYSASAQGEEVIGDLLRKRRAKR